MARKAAPQPQTSDSPAPRTGRDFIHDAFTEQDEQEFWAAAASRAREIMRDPDAENVDRKWATDVIAQIDEMKRGSAARQQAKDTGHNFTVTIRTVNGDGVETRPRVLYTEDAVTEMLAPTESVEEMRAAQEAAKTADEKMAAMTAGEKRRYVRTAEYAQLKGKRRQGSGYTTMTMTRVRP